jgi:hypothetical protein
MEKKKIYVSEAYAGFGPDNGTLYYALWIGHYMDGEVINLSDHNIEVKDERKLVSLLERLSRKYEIMVDIGPTITWEEEEYWDYPLYRNLRDESLIKRLQDEGIIKGTESRSPRKYRNW